MLRRTRRSQGNKKLQWRILGILLPIGFLLALIWIIAAPDQTEMSAGQTNANSSTQLSNRKTYENKEYGFTVSYPSGWRVTEGSAGEGDNRIVVANFSDSDLVTLSVMSESLIGTLRDSLSLAGELDRTIAGFPAIELRGASFKDGSPEVIYILKHEGTAYAFRGATGEALVVAESIQFTQ